MVYTVYLWPFYGFPGNALWEGGGGGGGGMKTVMETSNVALVSIMNHVSFG